MYDRCIATLIVTVLFGLIIAYFATQNTAVVSLNFLNYEALDIPLYVVIVGSLLAGLVLSWILSIVNGISTGFKIMGKESKIKDYGKENAEYLKQIHQLELENAKLKAQTNASEDDKSL